MVSTSYSIEACTALVQAVSPTVVDLVHKLPKPQKFLFDLRDIGAAHIPEIQIEQVKQTLECVARHADGENITVTIVGGNFETWEFPCSSGCDRLLDRLGEVQLVYSKLKELPRGFEGWPSLELNLDGAPVCCQYLKETDLEEVDLDKLAEEIGVSTVSCEPPPFCEVLGYSWPLTLEPAPALAPEER